MFARPHQRAAAWLIICAALLATLIPGGPIENRDFSSLHPAVLGVFNIVLTALNLGSLVLVLFVLRRKVWALQAAFVAAITYFGVYAIDLAQIFPRSPTPMSLALSLVEVLGMTAAVPLMFSVRRALHDGAQPVSPPTSGPVPPPASRPLRVALVAAVVATLVIGGIGIVWFATNAAMHSATVSLASPTALTD
ncbi:MAG: hypothetical protein AAGF11_24615 [Myxococcota bacterium]